MRVRSQITVLVATVLVVSTLLVQCATSSSLEDHRKVAVTDALELVGVPSKTGTPTVTVSPKTLEHGAQKITVSWAGITEPQESDRITINMAVPGGKEYPLGYYFMNQTATWKQGQGSVTLSLYHPRENAFVFRYVRGDKVFAQSNPLPAEIPELATQVRIALTHDASKMRVTYTRYNGTAPAQQVVDGVLYAPAPFDRHTQLHTVTDPSDPDWARAGEVDAYGHLIVRRVKAVLDSTYTLSDMCNEPANITGNFFKPGYFYEALLTDLKPQTAYWYAIVSTPPAHKAAMVLADAIRLQHSEAQVNAAISRLEKDYTTQTYSFVSSPTPGQDDEVSFFAFGDLGVGVPFMTQKELQPPAAETVTNMMNDLKQTWSQGYGAVDRPRLAKDGLPTTLKGVAPSKVLLIGDISYARGFSYLWEIFMQEIEPVASSVPWMITLGNHEVDWPTMPWHPIWSDMGNDSGGECGWPSYTRFHMPPDYVTAAQQRRGFVLPEEMPKPTWAELQMPASRLKQQLTAPTTPTYDAARLTPQLSLKEPRNIAYSYDFGPVHVTLFSGEHDFLPGSTQYKFIEDDLKSVDRSRTPWVIVATHRPLYCSSGGCSLGPDHMNTGTDNIFRETIEPLLLKYQVDLALWGHIHTYERTCPMKGNFECVKPGESTLGVPVHVVIGMSGNVYNGLWEPYLPLSESKSAKHHQQPDWSIFRSMNFGYTRINANRNELRLQYVGNHQQNIHDEFTLRR